MKVMITIFPSHLTKNNFITSGIGTLIFGAGGLTNILSGNQNGIVGGFFMDLQAELIGGNIGRKLAEHEIPGREGDVPQDMGGKLANITIKGKWIFENKPNDGIQKLVDSALGILGHPYFGSIGWNWIRLEMMKALARSGVPVFLANDFMVGPVLLVDFKWQEAGGSPNVYDYILIYKELNPALSVASNSVFTIGSMPQGLIEVGKRGF